MAELEQAWMEAFTEAQQKMPSIHAGRTADMGNYSYKYADLSDVLAAVLPVLSEHGLGLAQSTVTDEAGRVGVETRIYHSAGHVEAFGPLFLAAGGNAQAAGSAITYARRYSLTAALGLSTDNDDDGASAVRHTDAAAQPPSFDVGEWAKVHVGIFGEWDEDRRRQEWKEAIGDLFEGAQPSDPKEAKKVVEAMAAVYYAEFPPSEERPF